MNLMRIYTDELTGFFRSRVMHALWIGLPALTLILRLLQPDTEEIPLLMFITIVIAGIGGTLSSVLLSTTITNERNRGVYDLFLIRPVSRKALLLAKFFAALTALLVAVASSVAVGIFVDAAAGKLSMDLVRESAVSVVMSTAAMATACSVGLLFGVVFDSIALSAILSVYLGNQLSGVILLPAVFVDNLDPVLLATVAGILLPTVILSIALLVFERKSL